MLIPHYNCSLTDVDIHYEFCSRQNTAGKYRRSSKCLITLPSAGKARTHLRTRNLSPMTIHTFAIGYAPDCYYGDEAKMSKTISDTKNSNSWGAGSLLEYLAGTGFSPDKIVEAGLAVRTKRQQSTPGADSIHQLSSRTELKTNNNVNIQV